MTVDLKLAGDRVAAFGQTVKACLLGQAAASVMGRNIVGSQRARAARGGRRHAQDAESRRAAANGRWADLAVLEPVKDYKARHASTLLVFDAVESGAWRSAEAKRERRTDAAAAGAGTCRCA